MSDTPPDVSVSPARKVFLSDPPDYVGVYIEVHHQSLTGAVGMTRDFKDQFVAQLEPIQK